MEVSFGKKRVQKIFKGNECVNIGIPKTNLIYHLDSIEKTNYNENRNRWILLNNTNDEFTMNGFDYNRENGWLNNCLHFDGKKTYISKIYNNQIPVNMTFSISFHIPVNGKLVCTFPGINKVYTKDKDLIVDVSKQSGSYKISNVIKPNIFYNLTIAIDLDRIVVFLNGEKKYTSTNAKFNTNNITSVGMVNNEYGEMMLHSLQYYSSKLSDANIQSLYKIESDRFIVYHDKNLVLDIRGYNNLINYGGNICVRDNSIERNHPKANNFLIHQARSRAFNMVGMNNMVLTDRPILNGSFTIEIMFSKIKYQFGDQVFLFGQYDIDNYGIHVLLDTESLIIRLYNPEGNFEYKYKLSYINKRNSISIAYNNTTKTLSLYNNGYIVRSFTNVNYIYNVSDTTFYIGKDNSLTLPFIGNINCFRIYHQELPKDSILSNYNIDSSIYR